MAILSSQLPTKGVISDQLSQVITQKSLADPDFIVQLIHTYCTDVGMLLLEMMHCTHLPDVDFSKLTALAQKVEEKSSWIGAEHVRLASGHLIQFCNEKNKVNFSRALSWMENEFLQTQDKLDHIAQMEERIIRLKNKLKK
ncbi:hypothetical protein Ancab_007593 [Ancistrocladus abbreviatus]